MEPLSVWLFAERKMIKQLRQMKGLTQADLAKKVGVVHSYISQIEGGKPCPCYIAVKIAKALNIAPGRIFARYDAKRFRQRKGKLKVEIK